MARRLDAESDADTAPTLRYLGDETHARIGLCACKMDARRDPFYRRIAARIEAGTRGTTNEDCGTTNKNWGTTNKDWWTTNEDAVRTPVRDVPQATQRRRDAGAGKLGKANQNARRQDEDNREEGRLGDTRG